MFKFFAFLGLIMILLNQHVVYASPVADPTRIVAEGDADGAILDCDPKSGYRKAGKVVPKKHLITFLDSIKECCTKWSKKTLKPNFAYPCPAAHGSSGEIATLIMETSAKPKKVSVGDCGPNLNKIIYGQYAPSPFAVKAGCVSLGNGFKFCIFPQ